ncbi:PQQ-binding-like beta-propeller repeat protein [Streptomyces sp. NBC_01498]|uniref:outer membrane protein assembly factor BamB family protein n=1 Tax=Streptomyces sp. NBC_01498 TaxID=2975870 RepID=UPI002E7AC765|nr:PQQ-binding-like beta-propeller repeat protein [Streptomyces sp. NBC_01498]WTL28740.1 PQQ-binding-like beta-propeller repeat protein [Streptomyces sp. NBC_01498]
MEPLRHDDPRLVGPYTVLARYRESASAVRYLAYGANGATAVVTVARPALAELPAFRRRFRAETHTAERLAGGWVEPLLDSRTDGPDASGEGPLWTAVGYVPALTLGEAVAVAGPLPERSVRILGAALAETLSRVHATGAVLHGLAPDTVTLAADGPRLTAFGALGAAASAEAMEGGRLSVRLGYLTPEQVAGEVPGPPADLFVLGLLLAYASTGTTPLTDGPPDAAADRIARGAAELDRVPPELRSLVARCLAKEPGARPTAGAVAAELALEGAAAAATAVPGGWLPGVLAAAIAEQATWVDALHAPLHQPPHPPPDGPSDAVPGAPAGPGPGSAPDGVPDTRTTRIGRPRAASGNESGGADRPTAALSLPHARPEPTALPLPPAVAPVPHQSQPLPPGAVVPMLPAAPAAPSGPPALPPGPSAAGAGSGSGRFAALRLPLTQPLDRRALLTGIVAGAAGLVIGGGGVLALADDEPSDTTAGGKPDDKPGGGRRTGLTGLPPETLWAYEHPAAAGEVLNAAVTGGHTLVLTGGSGATAVDARTGKLLWRNADAAALHAALPAPRGLTFVAGTTGLFWLTTASGKVEHRIDYADGIGGVPGLRLGGVTGARDGQVWFTGSHTTGTGKTATVRTFLFAFDLSTHEELWRAAISNGRASSIPAYQLIAVRDADIVLRQDTASLLPAQVTAGKGRSVYHCFSRADGGRAWSRSFGAVPPAGGSVGDARGRLFVSVADQLYAYDTADARQLWRRSGAPRVPGQNPFAFGTGTLLGSTLYVANRYQEVYAVDPATGAERWKGTTEAPAWNGVPRITVSGSGRTVLSADGLQVTAFAERDGARLWKFQNAGGPAPSPAADGAPVATPAYQPLMAGRTAVIRRGGTFYALPVD